jgi:hypothetical protein
MVGRCIANSPVHLRGGAAEVFRKYVRLDSVELTLGRDYVILGVLFRDGSPWFLVCEDQAADYPKPHFGQFFDLVDDRIPPEWSLTVTRGNAGDVALLPTQWARDARFLEKLVDGEPGATIVFERLRRELDAWHATGRFESE